MEIKTTYNIGDKVTIEDYVTTYEQCSFCEGKGHIKFKGRKIWCPDCKGKGKVEKTELKPVTIDITDIDIHIDYQNHISIRYTSKHYTDGGNPPRSFSEVVNWYN